MRKGLCAATVGVVVALAVGPAAATTTGGRIAAACPNQAVNGGKVLLGRETVRVVAIGKVSCREAHRRVSAYFRKMAAGGCGTANNFCDLSFPGGWTCSIFFATESKETGGAIAGCARGHARIRLYRTKHPAPPNPSEFRVRLAGAALGCGLGSEGILCQGVPTTPAMSNPLVQIAKLQPDGQVTSCTEYAAAPVASCFVGNLGAPIPYLSPGQHSTIGPFTCKVLTTGVECTVVATGKGFIITSESVTLVGG